MPVTVRLFVIVAMSLVGCEPEAPTGPDCLIGVWSRSPLPCIDASNCEQRGVRVYREDGQLTEVVLLVGPRSFSTLASAGVEEGTWVADSTTVLHQYSDVTGSRELKFAYTCEGATLSYREAGEFLRLDDDLGSAVLSATSDGSWEGRQY